MKEKYDTIEFPHEKLGNFSHKSYQRYKRYFVQNMLEVMWDIGAIQIFVTNVLIMIRYFFIMMLEIVIHIN